MCTGAAAALQAVGLPVQIRSRDYPTTAVTLLLEACAAWACGGREDSGQRLGDLLGRFRGLAPQVRGTRGDIALVRVLGESGDCTAPATDFVARLLSKTGLLADLDAAGAREDAAAVEQMVAHLGRERAVLAAFAARALRDGRVVVTTTSSSKGLEFDAVIIVGANKKLMPSWQSRTAEELAEERRRLHVSLTRARDSVDIYYSGQVAWRSKTETTGPSPYLGSLGLLNAPIPRTGR